MFAFRNEAVKAWGELPRYISDALIVSSWAHVHTHTHTQQRTAPSTHTCTHVYTRVLTHGYKLIQRTYIHHTHLHHTYLHMPHRYVRNTARTHIHGTHIRTYTHTHTYTYRQELYMLKCTNTHMYSYIHIHKKTAYTVKNLVIRSRWGGGLILACEATCSKPTHPQ